MLDWKILAASIVALLLISSVFLGGFGIKEFLSGILETASEYLGSSPFEGILPGESSEGGEKEISILLTPDTISLTPDSEATLVSGETVFSGFTGEVSVHFKNSTVALKHSTLSVSLPLETLEIQSLEINSLSLQETSFEIKPDIATDSGNLELKGFSGTATATKSGLQLEGTVSSLNVEIGEMNFELV